MKVYEAVTKRRSIRQFKDKPVPHDILEKCVNAARLAPSAANRQPLKYVIVDDEKLLPRIFDTVSTWAGEPRPESGWAPGGRPRAYIISLIDTSLEAELGGNRTDTSYDIGMAVENMILVALEQGVGSCVIASFSPDRLRQVLNIPDKYEVALVLGLGFPDESPVVEVATDSVKRWVDDKGARHIPKRKLEDVLYRNRFP
jgi:nitroreductase